MKKKISCSRRRAEMFSKNTKKILDKMDNKIKASDLTNEVLAVLKNSPDSSFSLFDIGTILGEQDKKFEDLSYQIIARALRPLINDNQVEKGKTKSHYELVDSKYDTNTLDGLIAWERQNCWKTYLQDIPDRKSLRNIYDKHKDTLLALPITVRRKCLGDLYKYESAIDTHSQMEPNKEYTGVDYRNFDCMFDNVERVDPEYNGMLYCIKD